MTHVQRKYSIIIKIIKLITILILKRLKYTKIVHEVIIIACNTAVRRERKRWLINEDSADRNLDNDGSLIELLLLMSGLLLTLESDATEA